MLLDATSNALNVIQNGLPPIQGNHPKKVIVVGAGMAGLVAAYELRAGHDPLLLEAQSRVGGLYTLREPFAPGLFAEAGAMRMPRAHQLTLAYIEKFNLPVFPFTMGNPQAYCHLGGVRHRLAEVNASPALLDFDFTASERPKGVQRMWEEALAPLAAQVQSGGAAWDQIRLQNDQYSVRELLEFKGWSEGAIRQTLYDASAKIFMQFRRRFWEQDDAIYGGGSVTDLAIRIVYYPDHGRQTGRGVVLACYTWSEDAQRWGSLSPSDRIAQALENLAVLHPQASHEFECGASKMWRDDKFAGGAFALFDPEQQSLLYDAILAPEGRIYFAGEHASMEHAWIRGAIESGLRAAAEIHNKVKSL